MKLEDIDKSIMQNKILNQVNMKLVCKLNKDFGCSGFHIPINKQTIKLMDKKEKFINDIKRVQLLLNKTNIFDFFIEIEN